MTNDLYGRAAVTDVKPTCWKCGWPVAWYATQPWKIKCRRCRSDNVGGAPFEPPSKPPDSR